MRVILDLICSTSICLMIFNLKIIPPYFQEMDIMGKGETLPPQRGVGFALIRRLR